MASTDKELPRRWLKRSPIKYVINFFYQVANPAKGINSNSLGLDGEEGLARDSKKGNGRVAW